MEAARPEPSGDESGEGGGLGGQDMALEEGVLEASYTEASQVQAGRDGFYSLQVDRRMPSYDLAANTPSAGLD